MKIIPQLILLLTTMAWYSNFTFAQTDTSKGKDVKITQMTVMVIPRTNADQDIRNALDHSPCKRIAVAKLKEAFDKRGFQTIDFVGRLNAAKTDMAFMTANASDAKTIIIQFSGTDLIVEADIMISEYSPTTRVATVPVQCYDASSAFTLGISAVGCQSPPNQADTFSLVSRALDGNCFPNFLGSLTKGFDSLRNNGRPLKVHVSPLQSSKYNLLSKIPGSSVNIATFITNWLEDHTVHSNYVVLGSSKLELNLDDVRIPLLNSRNKNYRPFMFGNDLVSFLETGIKDAKIDSEIKNGTVYITIN